MSLDDFADHLEPAMSGLAASIEPTRCPCQGRLSAGARLRRLERHHADDVLNARKKLVVVWRRWTPDLQSEHHRQYALVDALGVPGQQHHKKRREAWADRGLDCGEHAVAVAVRDRPRAAARAGAVRARPALVTITNGPKTLKKGDIVTLPAATASIRKPSRIAAEQQSGDGRCRHLRPIPSARPRSAAHAECGGSPNAQAIKKVRTASTSYAISMRIRRTLCLRHGSDHAQGWTAARGADGISMRIVRQYDITNDKFFAVSTFCMATKTIRPQFACRLACA